MNDLTTAAVERLTAQLGEALFGEPGLSLMEIANRRAEIVAMRRNGEVFRSAVSSVIDASREYLPPDGITQNAFINRVLGAIDNLEIVSAMKEQAE